MFTMANKAYDFGALVEANRPESRAILQSIETAPDFVKEAEYSSDHDHLPDHVFGLILVEERLGQGQTKVAQHRMFPMPDAASAWLQTEALRRTGSSLPEEARKVASYHVKNAAERFDLPVPFSITQHADGMDGCSNKVAMNTLVPAQVKQAAAVRTQMAEQMDHDGLYGLVRPDERLYPLHTPELIKKAQDYFVRYEHEFEPSDRYEYCNKVAERAHAFGMPVQQKVAAYVGSQWDETGARQALQVRARQMKTAEQQQAVAELHDLVGAVEPVKFAALVEELDHATGFVGPDPYQAAVKTMEKVATRTVRGRDLEDLNDREIASVVIRNQDKLSSYLGRGVTRSLADNPQSTLDALDDDQRAVLENIVNGGM